MSEQSQAVSHMAVGAAEFEPLDPYGSLAVLYESDERLRVAGAWNFSPGTFDYQLPYDLFLYVIKGQTYVRVEDGSRVALIAGDVAYFAAGSNTFWEATEEIHAVFFCISNDKPIDIFAV